MNFKSFNESSIDKIVEIRQRIWETLKLMEGIKELKPVKLNLVQALTNIHKFIEQEKRKEKA